MAPRISGLIPRSYVFSIGGCSLEKSEEKGRCVFSWGDGGGVGGVEVRW